MNQEVFEKSQDLRRRIEEAVLKDNGRLHLKNKNQELLKEIVEFEKENGFSKTETAKVLGITMYQVNYARALYREIFLGKPMKKIKLREVKIAEIEKPTSISLRFEGFDILFCGVKDCVEFVKAMR